MNPKVSVIVPAYNVEHKIRECLNSILLQTYDNKEIIVVDDGSTDRTSEICDLFEKKHDCIKVIHQKNKGVSVARNVAMNNSSGTYIVFVDSDDVVEPQYIDELMKWKEYDFVTSGYYWQKPDMSWEIRKFEDTIVTKEELKANPSKFMGKYYFGSPWATLMKKEIIDFANLKFNENIKSGEDTLFIFKYLQYVDTIKIISVCGYKYYYYPNSLANTKHDNFWKWKILVEKEIYNFFNPSNNEEQTALLNRIFDVLRDLLRDYSHQMSNQELFSLYKNPFFKDCIAYKKRRGTIKEHVLIYSVEWKHYELYVMVDKTDKILMKVINKLKRIAKKYRG